MLSSTAALANEWNGPASEDLARRIGFVLDAPGPYVTIYASLGDERRSQWADLEHEVRRSGATDEAIDVASALFRDADRSRYDGIGLVVAADGTSVRELGHEPPHRDLVAVGDTPRTAPLIEWAQGSVPHVVLSVGDEGAVDLALFGRDEDRLMSAGADPLRVAQNARIAVRQVDAELVAVVGAPRRRRRLRRAVRRALHPAVRLVNVDPDPDPDKVAAAIVREVADVDARRTVALLREFRRRVSSGRAVDGLERVCDVLNDGRAAFLLVHDDAGAEDQLYVSEDGVRVSPTPTPDAFVPTRAADALLRSALLQGVSVRVIPSTGKRGPDDDVAAFVRRGATLRPALRQRRLRRARALSLMRPRDLWPPLPGRSPRRIGPGRHGRQRGTTPQEIRPPAGTPTDRAA